MSEIAGNFYERNLGLTFLLPSSHSSLVTVIGGIPNGVIIGKTFFGKDPRDYGSHNSGGTNSGRVFGKAIGITVIVLDILKAIVAFWAAWAILRFSGVRSIEGAPLFDDGVFYNWLTLLGVAVGHCWSPYLKFKGGKTVACYMGAVGGTSWLGGILCFIAFFVPYAFKKGVVSVASLLSGAVLCLFEWAMYLIVALSGWPGTILDVELRSGRRSLLWLGKRQRCYFDLSHSCSSTFGQHQTP
jgi:glycerol-3-phosphate acyltransferase PlsY